MSYDLLKTNMLTKGIFLYGGSSTTKINNVSNYKTTVYETKELRIAAIISPNGKMMISYFKLRG